MNKIIQLGNINRENKKFSNPQPGRVYSINGISPTLNTCQGGQREPKIIIMDNDKDDYMKIVCERRIDEGLRTFKNDTIGTIRTIDSGEIKE